MGSDRVRFVDGSLSDRLWDPAAYVAEDGTRRWFVNGDGVVSLVCPHCGVHGQLTTRGPHAWAWDGNMDRPTVSPSILVGTPRGGCGFHCFVRDGQIIDAGTPPHGGAN